MKVLITGSSGYLGRIAVSHLSTRGCEIIGVDLRKTSGYPDSENFRYYSCCTTDRKGLRDIFSLEQPDAVLHLACTMSSVRNRKREFDLDVGGSLNVFNTARETPSVKKIVYSSSAAIYGPALRKDHLLDEAEPLKPGKYRYGINKRLIEQMLFADNGIHNQHYVALRICTVVGPRYSKPKSVVSILIRLPFLPESFRYSRVQFMHEDDFAELIGRIMEDIDIDGIFNFAPDSWTVVGDVVPRGRFHRFPCTALWPFMWILWNLRLLNLQPAGLGYCLYPVVLDSKRLAVRYGYCFRHSSTESFLMTRDNNSLPADARF